MSEPARGENEGSAVSPSGRLARAWLGGSAVVACGLAGGIASVCVGWLPPDGGPAGAWGVTITVILAGLSCAVVARRRHRRRWAGPARVLAELLPRVQRGEAPIDELEDLDARGLGPLVGAVRDVVRELRQQRAAVAELELEVRQRVASHTDALERTIGTLRRQATRDALTGLFNRRFLDQYLPQCVRRHARERRDLCLLMIDLDNFKALNDTLGHAAGDDLLRAVGQLIRSTARGDDVAFRCGGDEFVVLLPGYGADAGRALAGRLASLVDALGRTLKVPVAPRLAVGLATLAGSTDPTPAGLLAEADRRLYDVKRSRKGATTNATPRTLQATVAAGPP